MKALEPCTEVISHPKITFEQKRSKLTLDNKTRVKFNRVELDKCILREKACDFILFNDIIEVYIELKGQKINEAYKQIVASLKRWGSAKKQSKAYIICTSVPMVTTEVQSKQKLFRINHHSVLIIKSSPFEDKI